MQKELWLWQLGGLTFATALGTILHFLFDWTGAYTLAPISAVNESTFEHMKILFFPMLIFACIQSVYFKREYSGFWWIKLIGVVVAVGSIPVFFYTFNGAFGKTPDWLNITFFFLSAGLGYLVEWVLFKRDFALGYSFVAVGILIGLALLFVVCTFVPPKLPLFQDPVTQKYGITNG